jgi:DinB superfamily
VADSKDWTWVLGRACPECGLDTREVAPGAVAGMVRAVAAEWAGVLGADGVRVRPAEGVWSPLEYGCHVRDVLRIYDRRLGLMLTEDDPLFPNWDQDETAVAERYGEQDPATVARELQDAGTTLAAHFDQVHGDQWNRPGRRSDGADFTVATFARYFVHDPVHHLWDARAR